MAAARFPHCTMEGAARSEPASDRDGCRALIDNSVGCERARNVAYKSATYGNVARWPGAANQATYLWLALIALMPLSAFATQRPPVVTQSRDSAQLAYKADAAGDRVPDFSSAGYRGGGVPLPTPPARVMVTPVTGDNGPRIQAAIDYVAGLNPDRDGIRGAVELKAGRYEISSQLRITANGVVLRGEGANGNKATVLVATGTDRRPLILVEGKNDRQLGRAASIVDPYVAVGATVLHVRDSSGVHAGAQVVISRPATTAWFHAIGMDVAPGREQFVWRVPAMTLTWDRVVTAVKGDTLTLDAPITTALDEKFGGGTVASYDWPGRIQEVGVEHLRCESSYDPANPLDEQHAWEAVRIDAARDAWVNDVTAVHFAGSAFNVGPAASRITIEDCASLAPVSELGGYRRHTFHTDGQQTLFLRCHAEDGRNDFTVGYLAGGPNVFLDCSAARSHGFSGSTGSWASGILFDNVTLDGGTLELTNRETWNQGVGWAAANSMLWQCSAPVVICRAPPTAQNWADGVWGQFVGDGWWSQVNEFIHPDSLYEAQLVARLGTQALAVLEPHTVTPTIAANLRIAELGGASTTLLLSDLQHARASGSDDLQSAVRHSERDATASGTRSSDAAIGATAGGAPTLEQAVPDLAARIGPKPKPAGKPLALSGGWLTVGGQRLSGRELELSWWRGYMLEKDEPTQPAITRFAPGRTGPIFTDDLDALTNRMAAAHEVVARHHYGLWYDRRRMDHERMRRPDADVWPPFYEQPFARSGEGTAWDGLSRYDLTKYNPWYFARLHEFAELARQKGLVLIDEMYFQHNILEAGAHWVDSPWRPTNNINGTHFTEPVPFTGDTQKMAPEFYDLSDPRYRALHRAYIRQCLANLADEPNVIHTCSAEYSGPLSFMEFWLDVVAEWESETGKHPLIALSACKDVQDAILADPKRSKVVDVIDLTYWFRTANGKEFAPHGGTDLAPRQQLRLWRAGRPNAASIAEMAREYRAKYPGKAVITGLPEAGDVQPQ